MSRRDAKESGAAPDGAGGEPSVLCTLSDDGLSERLAWIRAEILPHVVASEPGPDGIAWELQDAPGLAAKLERLVALERECCSGLVFEFGAGAGPGRLRLAVRGIDPRASVLAVLAGGSR